MTKRPHRSIITILLLLATLPAAHAVTFLNDTFANGNRSTQDLPNSAAFYFGSTSAGGSLDVVSNALEFGYTGSTGILSQAVAYFTESGSPVSLSVGDTLSVSFTFSGANIPNAQDSLRIGLYDSGGNRVSADTAGIADAEFNSYTGYGFWANPNAEGSNTARLVQRTGNNNTLFAASAYTNLKSSGAPLGYSADTTYTLNLSVAYTSTTEVDLTFSDSNGYVFTVTDTVSPYTSFDTFALFLNNGSSADNTYTVDNVLITAIPEPGTAALVIGAITGLFALRRKPRTDVEGEAISH